MTDRLHKSNGASADLPLNGRTPTTEEMPALLQHTRQDAPAAPTQVERPQMDFGRIPFESPLMDPDVLSRLNRTLRPDEISALSTGISSQADQSLVEHEETSPPAAPPLVHLPAEKTPAEYSHLYAALERQIAGVGDVTLLSGETLGNDRPYVLGVTSALVGEGKTTVALHLAMTIARDTYKRVCLIDLSLGKGDLAARLGVPQRGEGVVSVLEDNSHVVPTLQIAGLDNLVIIPAGKVPANSPRLVRSPRVAQLILSARAAFDVVIVDMPAVATDHALPLTRHIDGLLVVARAGVTPRDVVSQALDVLGRDKVIGVTLNRIQKSGPSWLRKRLGGV